MQASTILRKPLSTEWAVTAPRSYASKKDRRPETIPRRNTRKIKLVSTKYYRRSGMVRNDTAYFEEAPTDDRRKGFLVYDEREGQFWVAPSVDFIGIYEDCDNVWSVEEQRLREIAEKREAEQRAYEQQMAARNAREAKAREVGVRLVAHREKSIPETLNAILGEDTSGGRYNDISYRLDWDDEKDQLKVNLTGWVRIPVRDFERLIEKYNDALDAAR